METVDSRKRAVYWIHTFVYFLLTFCFGYLPFHALTPFGMTIVGIFIGLLYGWTFIGFVWPSMMSIFALGLCGYFKTPQAAFASAFSNHLVIFMLLVLVFTAYCEKSGINKKLSCWFLSRKGLAGKPWCFTFMVLLGTFVVSFLVDGNAVVFLVWNLMYSVFDETAIRRGIAIRPTCWRGSPYRPSSRSAASLGGTCAFWPSERWRLRPVDSTPWTI